MRRKEGPTRAIWAVRRRVRAWTALLLTPFRRKVFSRFAARVARSHCRRRAFKSWYVSFLYWYRLRRSSAETIFTFVSFSARPAGSRTYLQCALFLGGCLRRRARFVRARKYGLVVLKRVKILLYFARKSSRRQ